MAVKKNKDSVAPVAEESTPVETPATNVTVNADDLIKSIVANVGNNNAPSRQYIMCRSVTVGGLNINCKSGNVYEFTKYGSDCEIEYHDLAGLVRKHSDHIFLPRIVVEDENFIEKFPQLNKVYENMYTSEDIDELFTLSPSQMISAIKSMPKHVADGLKTIVSTKIANGSIDSVRTIRALADYYDCDFNMISELFSK